MASKRTAKKLAAKLQRKREQAAARDILDSAVQLIRESERQAEEVRRQRLGKKPKRSKSSD